jgi:hypothetical protein
MKKLTKRNRTHNQKAIFGYGFECGDGWTHRSSKRTRSGLFWLHASYTCKRKPDNCCHTDD